MYNVSCVSIEIDTDLKNQAEALFASLGLDMATAFDMFLRQSVRERKIPFDVTINVPSSETIAAMLETTQLANNPSTKTYSVEDALRELKL